MDNTYRKQCYHITALDDDDDEKHHLVWHSSKWTTTLCDRCSLWAATKLTYSYSQISFPLHWLDSFMSLHHLLIVSLPDRQLIFCVIRMAVQLSSSIVNKSNKKALCRFVDGGSKGVPSVWAGLGSVLWESTWQPPRSTQNMPRAIGKSAKKVRAGPHLMSEWAHEWI